MKLIRSAIILVTVFFLFGMTTKSKLVGYWELYKVENSSELKTRKKRTKFIEFHKDGKLTGGRIGESPNKSGKWELKKKTVTLITPDYPKENGDYEIIELSRKSLILHRDGIKIYLDKGENN